MLSHEPVRITEGIQQPANKQLPLGQAPKIQLNLPIHGAPQGVHTLADHHDLQARARDVERERDEQQRRIAAPRPLSPRHSPAARAGTSPEAVDPVHRTGALWPRMPYSAHTLQSSGEFAHESSMQHAGQERKAEGIVASPGVWQALIPRRSVLRETQSLSARALSMTADARGALEVGGEANEERKLLQLSPPTAQPSCCRPVCNPFLRRTGMTPAPPAAFDMAWRADPLGRTNPAGSQHALNGSRVNSDAVPASEAAFAAVTFARPCPPTRSPPTDTNRPPAQLWGAGPPQMAPPPPPPPD
jgi:hypothetical protein